MVNDQRIDRLAEYLGWIAKVGLTKEESARANQARDSLLESLEGLVQHSFAQTKIHYGDLSPGCVTCGQGTWSCLFISHVCNASCFFCPMDRAAGRSSPMAEQIVFEEPETYIDYLGKFGFRGVGFSGGEPLLAFDRLLPLIRSIKQQFGSGMYVWLYTNGNLVDARKLASLREAGLDEIRFNIHARDYDMGPVKLARGLINRITVEIPGVPEDYETLRECMLAMDSIGVDHLNIHQLVATQQNYQILRARGYTFAPSLAFHEVPVLESEMAALRLIEYAAARETTVALNYCSHAYKARFAKLARRRRAAPWVQTDLDRLTAAGYISRLSVAGTPASLRQIIRTLQAQDVQKSLWWMDASATELFFHHSLLKHIDVQGRELIVRVYEPHLVSQLHLGTRKLDDVKEIELNSDQTVFAGRQLVMEKRLAGQELQLYVKFLDDSIRYQEAFAATGLEPGVIPNFPPLQQETLPKLESLERISVGLAEIYSSDLL